MQLSELQKRFIFGILAAIVAALAIYQGGSTFFLLIIMVAGWMSFEFDQMRRDGQLCFIFCVVPIVLFAHPVTALCLVALAVFIVMVLQAYAKRYFSWLLISILYISLPAISVLWLRDQKLGLHAVIWLSLVIIATDVGAYFIGKGFGSHLLAPTISPKKTWEGFGGGILCASVVSFIISEEIILTLVAIIISILGQVSDLAESAIKRNFNVKDSGNLFPGHGGIMDRIDGFIFTAPAVALLYHAGIIQW